MAFTLSTNHTRSAILSSSRQLRVPKSYTAELPYVGIFFSDSLSASLLLFPFPPLSSSLFHSLPPASLAPHLPAVCSSGRSQGAHASRACSAVRSNQKTALYTPITFSGARAECHSRVLGPPWLTLRRASDMPAEADTPRGASCVWCTCVYLRAFASCAKRCPHDTGKRVRCVLAWV